MPTLEQKTVSAAPAAHNNADVGADSGPCLDILLVDDSTQIQEFLRLKLPELAPAGFSLNLTSATSGDQAIKLCQENTYDLIFLDVEMPGKDGFETCVELRKLSGARIAMLTSKSMAEDFRKGNQSGCNHYLVKPPHDADVRVLLSLTSIKKR